MKIFFNKKGFTLLELLVVVLIIGILAGIAIPQYRYIVEKTRNTEAINNLSTIARGIDVWLITNGWPTTTSSTDLVGTDTGHGRSMLLDIDIESAFECNPEGVGYIGFKCKKGKYFYGASCNKNVCNIYADNPNVIGLEWRKRKESDSYWEKLYESRDELGDKLAVYLDSQGWREC